VVVERKMDTAASLSNDHLVLWLAAILMLFGVGLGDIGIVALYASVVSLLQLEGLVSEANEDVTSDVTVCYAPRQGLAG